MLRNVRDSPARGLSEVLLLGGKEERDGKRERERERERWREIKAKRERESAKEQTCRAGALCGNFD